MKFSTTYTLIVLMSALSFSSSCAQVMPEEGARFKQIETDIEKLIGEYHTAGLSVAIIEGGNTTYAKGFGFSNVESQTRASSETVYGIGSCTKAFTASLLGILEKEGRLTMSDKPMQHIPSLRFHNKDMNNSITISHLLSHSTGISRMGSESSCVLFESDNSSDLIERLAHLEPEKEVGAAFIYSNYMYTIAGVIGEKITGNLWSKNLEQMIFKPLHLKHTYANYHKAKTDSNFSLGYAVDTSLRMKPVLPELGATRAPAGAIFSNVLDMAKWLQVWMHQGKYKETEFLSPSFVAEATGNRQLMRAATDSTSAGYYGYGWMSRQFHGRKRIEHSGGVSGYGSNVVYFPEEEMGVVVLTNQTGSGIAGEITEKFIANLLKLDPIDDTKNPEPVFFRTHVIAPAFTPTMIKKDEAPSLPLKDFSGKYHHPGFGTIEVSYEDGTLFADMPFTKMRLEHQGDNLFYDHLTEEIPLMYWNFMRLDFINSGKGIDGILINLQADPVLFERVAP